MAENRKPAEGGPQDERPVDEQGGAEGQTSDAQTMAASESGAQTDTPPDVGGG